MIRNGAARLTRWLAFCLSVLLTMSACVTTAFAADIWNQITLNILWENDEGLVQSAPAMPVQQGGETAFWAQVDASAYGKLLTVEVTGAPDHVFYLLDESGSPVTQFFWMQDAPGLDAAYAYPLYYATVSASENAPLPDAMRTFFPSARLACSMRSSPGLFEITCTAARRICGVQR